MVKREVIQRLLTVLGHLFPMDNHVRFRLVARQKVQLDYLLARPVISVLQAHVLLKVPWRIFFSLFTLFVFFLTLAGFFVGFFLCFKAAHGCFAAVVPIFTFVAFLAVDIRQDTVRVMTVPLFIFFVGVFIAEFPLVSQHLNQRRLHHMPQRIILLDQLFQRMRIGQQARWAGFPSFLVQFRLYFTELEFLGLLLPLISGRQTNHRRNALLRLRTRPQRLPFHLELVHAIALRRAG